MGQKTHPLGFRLGIIEPWRSRWYADKRNFGRLLVEDHKIRSHIAKSHSYAGVARVEIERTKDKTTIFVYSARPGIIIGRKGVELDRLRADLAVFIRGVIDLKVVEVEAPEVCAQLVAQGVGEQLMKRAPFRRVIKRAIETVIQAGALGIKVRISGRLGGNEIARTEQTASGAVPLHTLTARIDYGTHFIVTTAGVIGIKVWIYKGRVKPGRGIRPDVVPEAVKEEPERAHA
jgi:small subunit ribosomal protein S3